MTQNKNKKGIAKKALSISLVAAMLATSNVPVWASGFTAESFDAEAQVQAEGFAAGDTADESIDGLADSSTLSATVTGDDLKFDSLKASATNVIYGTTVSITGSIIYNTGAEDQTLLSCDYRWQDDAGKIYANGTMSSANVSAMSLNTSAEMIGKTLTLWIKRDTVESAVFDVNTGISVTITAQELSNVNWEGSLETGKAVYTYDGKEHKPNITSFVYNGVTYSPNTANCQVEYDYPTDAVSVTDTPRTIIAYITITLTDGTEVELQATSDYEIRAIDISNATMTVGDIAYDATAAYNLTNKDVTVVNGNETLEFGIDYEISKVIVNNDNKAGGQLLVTATGKGNYAGTVSRTVTISAVNLSDWTIDDIADQSWTGNEIKPPIAFKNSNGNPVSLVANQDYTVSYSNNVNTGTATVTVNGINNYTGTITKTFKIVAPAEDWNGLIKAIKEDLTNTDPADLVYTGSPITWVDNVYATGKYVMGRDFTVSYAPQNVNVGTVTMTVTGIGTYSNAQPAIITYQIDEKAIDASDVNVSVSDIPYSTSLTPDAIKDAITITYKGMTLREKNDFTFGTPTFTNGTFSVTVTGIGNYEKTRTITKKVTAKDINTVTLPVIANKVYDGEKYDVTRLGNEFVLKDGDNTLSAGTDYVIVREYNNTNVGMATIEVAGRGNYTGTATINFLIVEKELIGTIVTTANSPIIPDQPYSYTAASSDAGITVTGGLKVIDIKGADITAECRLVYENNTSVGTATVSAVRINDNTNVTVAQATFRIVPTTLPAIDGVNNRFEFSSGSNVYTYTGDAIEPEVTVTLTDGRYTLVEGTDYEISYAGNVNVDDDSYVVITGKGNYAAIVDNKVNTIPKDVTKFTIQKASITTADITVNDVAYAGGIAVEEDITIKNPASGKVLEKGTDYTLTFSPNNVEVGRVTATIALTTEAAKNYSLATNQVTFNITKKALSDCDVTVVNGVVTVKNGEITVPTSEYTVTDNGDDSYTITANASSNYTGTVTAYESIPDAPAGTTLSVTNRTTSTVSLAWDEVEGAEGYTIWFRSEYDDSVSRKIIHGGDTTTWTQTGLQPGTKYFYTVRAWIDNGTEDAHDYIFGEQSPVQRGTTKPLAARITAVSASNGKVKVTLAGPAAGAEMYSMCYGDSRTCFKENDFKVGIRTQYTTRTLTPTFKAGTYYVCVKSYRDLGNNKRVYGEWSNTFRVVVK